MIYADVYFTTILLDCDGHLLVLNQSLPYNTWEEGLSEARRGLDTLLNLNTGVLNVRIYVSKHSYMIDDNERIPIEERHVVKVNYP